MRDRIRRWLGIDSRERGTLALLDDGLVIVGFPDGTNEEAARLFIQQWESRSPSVKTFVFGWPVEVRDLRRKRP